MIMRQHAAGDFVCEVVPGAPHCGKDDNRGHFRFCVDIAYRSEAALDDRDFLLDNLEFQAYFDGLGPVSKSCERLALDACTYFQTKLGARCRHVESIVVKVYPFGDVFVEADDAPAERADAGNWNG